PERGIYGNGIIGVQQNPTTKALELADYFAPSNAEWLFKRDLDMQVTPAIFDYKGRELMVSAGKECRVYLMDTESIGGDDHRTPLYRTPLLCNEGVNFASAGIWGAMTTWVDASGTRWVLAPFWGPKHSLFPAPRRSRPGTTGPACRSRTAASTSARSTARCTASASVHESVRGGRGRDVRRRRPGGGGGQRRACPGLDDRWLRRAALVLGQG